MDRWEREDQRARDKERSAALKAAYKKAQRTGKPVAVIYGPRGYYLGTPNAFTPLVARPDPDES